MPPKRIFASTVRREFGPRLEWLPTHCECNSSYRKDEEYFVASFAGHVLTPSADAVMKNLGDAARKGHGVGLYHEVISRFGQIVGSQGEVLYSYDRERIYRFICKLVRGLYCLGTGAVLPQDVQVATWLVNPVNPPDDLERIGWFPM